MSLEFNSKNQRIGWRCKSNHYKIITTNVCNECGDYRPVVFESYAIRKRIEWELHNDIALIFGRFGNLKDESDVRKFESFARSKLVDAKIELHMQFYNNQGILNKDRSDEELQEHLEELANIAFEAKARIARTSDDLRERKVKRQLIAGELLSKADSEFDNGSAISTVTERKKRMSKSQKLLDDMSKLLGVSGAAEILGKVDKARFNPENIPVAKRLENSKHEKPVSELCRIDKHDDCVGRFRIDETSFVCTCKCHAPKVDWDDPFGLNPKDDSPKVQLKEKVVSNEPIMDLSFDDLMK